MGLECRRQRPDALAAVGVAVVRGHEQRSPDTREAAAGVPGTCRFSCTRSASLLASAVSRTLLCSRRAALVCPRPASLPLSCSSSRASFLLDSSRRFIFLLKPLDS